MSTRPGAEEISGFLPAQLYLVHAAGTVSIFKAEIPVKHPVFKLKKDMEHLFHIRPELQEWYFKGKKVLDSQSLFQFQFQHDDKITVKTKAIQLEEEEEYANEAIAME